MSKRLRMILLTTMVLAMVGALPALAQARGASSVTKPKLSATPVMGEAFTVSGVVKPKATTTSRTVVKIKLYMLMNGHWGVTETYRAKLTPIVGGPGTMYSRTLTIPMEGEHAVRALPLPGRQAGQDVRVHLVRRRPAGQHRLDGQRVDGA